MNEITRRYFFGECGVGLGKIALGSLLAQEVAKPPHARPKAKGVIHLFMAGAPSHLDLFDPKPELVKFDGKSVPAEVVKDQRYAFIQRDAQLMAPRFKFAKHGESGAELSDVMPHLAKVVDELAFVRSVHTDQFNHAPAQMLFTTGSPLPGRPSLGSWLSYGLGSESRDLPAFVVLFSGSGASSGSASWSSGFLPTRHQGVAFRAKGDPVLFLSNPKGVDDACQRDTLDALAKLNRERLGAVGDPEIATRIAAYEMAYRMQSSAPELTDLSKESKETLALYGAEPGKGSFASNALLARRLVERGVRCVLLFHEGWDHHSDVAGGLRGQCGQTDRACAGLITDLRRRGLLDETLVMWGGEFGRTPMVESNAALGRALGRDHHPQAFTMWFAGGGVKPGITLGKTDDLGFHIAERPVHVHDIQATALRLLGLDHEKLTYFYQGRNFRLTDVHGKVIPELLA
ncbi:MAG TPA: DUF1501 domain-containing protein [Planctomycetota bacterium]